MDLHLMVLAVVTVLVVRLMWPSGRAGERLLVRWGVARPTAAQVAAARRYLRRRRILYPVFWIVVPLAVGMLDSSLETRRSWGLLASILAALLLAELVAALRPPRGTRRSAVLSRRRWRDLVPRGAVAVHLLVVGLAVVQAVAVLLAHGWAADVIAHARVSDDDPGTNGPGTGRPGDLPVLTIGVRTAHDALNLSDTWLTLAGAAVGLTAVYGVVLLAVLRPAETDPEVDFALRTRSARVAVGIGIGLALGLLNQANSHVLTLHSIAVQDHTAVSPPPALLDLAARVDGFGMIIVLGLALGAWLDVVRPAPRPHPAVKAPA